MNKITDMFTEISAVMSMGETGGKYGATGSKYGDKRW